MNRRNALKAVVAGAIGLLSREAVFTHADTGTGQPKFTDPWDKMPDDITWNLGMYKTLTLIYGDKRVVLNTKDIFDALYK